MLSRESKVQISIFLAFSLVIGWCLIRSIKEEDWNWNQCEKSYLSDGIPNIVLVEKVEAGQYQTPDGQIHDVPSFCRVKGVANRDSRRNIIFELWMPAKNWDGRFKQLGNSGYSGSIQFGPMVDTIKSESIAVATNDGHFSESGLEAKWALNAPELVIDYAYRAQDWTYLRSQEIVERHYGQSAEFNYFLGCSTGGRQALKMAQMRPEYWDGILAGAPAIDWAESILGRANFLATQWKHPNRLIPTEKLEYVEGLSLSSCTSSAREIDGVAAAPQFCKFDPSRYVCATATDTNCLTVEEVEVLETIYNGVFDPKSGELIYPGFMPTMENYRSDRLFWQGWSNWITSPARNQNMNLRFVEEFFRYIIYADPDWSIENFDLEKEIVSIQKRKIKDTKLSDLISVDPLNFFGLSSKFPKVIMYSGWGDEVLSPLSTIHFYNELAQDGSLERSIEELVKLYMIPGMSHCVGGTGASGFGQAGDFLPSLKSDAKHDIIEALQNWAENGNEPERVIAVKYIENNPEEGVEYTRPLCAFPEVSSYNGLSSLNTASSFDCVRPENPLENLR